jgi:putative adhesin
MKFRFAVTAAALAVALGAPILGQTDDPCRNASRDRDDYYQHCEVREESMAAGPLTVDAGTNGGIRVEGWDQNAIRVQATVQASARDEARARELAQSVQVLVGGGRVTANGPSTDRREWWSVSYRINVPRHNDLDLRANNGGITIGGVGGNIKFDTNNGGVRLSDLAGMVRGETHNGGLTVVLGGRQWDGDGLDVETTNGGVTLSIPDGYNAQLETRTVNGGFRFDYPLTIQGELAANRGITTTLGSGGAPIRVRTTNGGLRINRR